MGIPQKRQAHSSRRPQGFWDASTSKKAAFALGAAILSVTVGAVLENTWATPDQYLRFVPVKLPVSQAPEVRDSTATDTVVWRAENWGGKALSNLVIRIGNPQCAVAIVDGSVAPAGRALVNISMSKLYPQDRVDHNVIEYMISSWPREGILTIATVFRGPHEARCYTGRVISTENSEVLIVTDAPRLWVFVRATPMVAASLTAVILLSAVALGYLAIARRKQ
jgi:hypothetical protein